MALDPVGCGVRWISGPARSWSQPSPG